MPRATPAEGPRDNLLTRALAAGFSSKQPYRHLVACTGRPDFALLVGVAEHQQRLPHDLGPRIAT